MHIDLCSGSLKMTANKTLVFKRFIPKTNAKAKADPRFREWQPNEKSPKASILEHLDWAHETQSRRDCYRWLSNFQYFYKKYSKRKLLEIHAKYHEERGI